MILKASQRGGVGELARNLLRTDENVHVEVYERRGFVADDVRGAFQEAYALSKGTRCRQFLFSLSRNPPQTQTKAMIATRMTATVRDDIRAAERGFSRRCDRLALDRRDMARRQQSERKTLRETQEQRWIREANERAARLARGLRGLWQKLTGRCGHGIPTGRT